MDAALLVASVTNEAATGRIRQWFAANVASDLVISDWVVTELSSALSIKLRTRQITPDERDTALTAFRDVAVRSLTSVPVTSAHFRLAARFADNHDLALKAGDALHLAIAFEHGATLCTLDRKLAAAGPPLAAPTLLV